MIIIAIIIGALFLFYQITPVITIVGTTLFLFYQITPVKSVINNAIPKIFLNGISNKKFDKYAYLNENKTESEKYRILKLADKIPEFILFDRISENFILTGDELYLTTIRKINNKGEEIDSLEIKGHLYPSGMFFYENHYIDWAITGNKSKQKYDAIIDYDSLSEKEFEDYLNKADIVDFTHFSKPENSEHYTGRRRFVGRCHLKLQDKWIVIESKKMFEELEKDYEKEYFELKHEHFSKKNSDRLIALKNQIIPFHDWKKQDNMIFIQKFRKKSYSRESLFGNFNNHGPGTGWHGTGYFQLTYKSEIFNFKSYTFKSKRFSFDPGILIYFPDKKHNIDLVFIHLRGGVGSKRSSSESGIYILKNK